MSVETGLGTLDGQLAGPVTRSAALDVPSVLGVLTRDVGRLDVTTRSELIL